MVSLQLASHEPAGLIILLAPDETQYIYFITQTLGIHNILYLEYIYIHISQGGLQKCTTTVTPYPISGVKVEQVTDSLLTLGLLGVRIAVSSFQSLSNISSEYI